jgi:DNA polymerase IV
MTPARILLADADAFFAAVARLVDPEGAGKATLLVVGGRRGSRGVVCSASWEARQFGVRSAMPIARAEKLCPQAMFVPVPGKECGIKSKEIRRVLEKFTPIVSGASVDEWYMDLGGTEGIYHNESLRDTAHRIRGTVKRETGMSVSIGGGTNRLVAKMAVERAKAKPGTTADGVHIVAPGAEGEFLRTFNLGDIPMVGPKFQAKLASLGMVTVPDLLKHDIVSLRRMLGTNAAEWLWDRAHGISGAEVEGHYDRKSMSRDETFAVDLTKDEDIERELLGLVTKAAWDLRQGGFTARTITVKLRDRDFKTRSARRTLLRPVVSDRVIMETAKELLKKLRGDRRIAARLIGVALSSLSEDPRADQLNLFQSDDQRLETDRDLAIARTVDRVRKKFGSGGIISGALIGDDVRRSSAPPRPRGRP